MENRSSHCITPALAMLFALLCWCVISTDKLQAQTITPARIILNSDKLKEKGQCDSVILLLNSHLAQLREAGDMGWVDYYESALHSLIECHKTLATPDSVEHTMLKMIDYQKDKYGVKSTECKISLDEMINYWYSQKDSVRQIEFLKVKLDPTLYDFEVEYDTITYKIAFAQYASLIDTTSVEKYAESLLEIAQGSKAGKDLANEYIKYKKISVTHDVLNSVYSLRKANKHQDIITLLADNTQYFVPEDYTFNNVLSCWISANSALSDLCLENNDYENAEKHLIENIEKARILYGEANYNYGQQLVALANFYVVYKADYDKAIQFLAEAKKLKDIYLENYSESEYLKILQLLSFSKFETGKFEEAAALISEETPYLYSRIYEMLFSKSETERDYWWRRIYRQEVINHYRYANEYGGTFSTLAYNSTLLSKGLMLRTASTIRNAILESNDGKLIKDMQTLSMLRDSIEKMRVDDANVDSIKLLSSKYSDLDRQITLASAKYRDLKADISMTWEDVQRQLKPDEAAIEFVDFGVDGGPVIYAALVLRSGTSMPQWISLCDYVELSDLLMKVSDNPQIQTKFIYQTIGSKLYDMVWKPLEASLNGVKTIYYSPTDLLHRIALNALPTEEQKVLLSDKYNLNLVSSTREIVRMRNKNDNVVEAGRVLPLRSATIYGGLYYDENQQDINNQITIQQSGKKEQSVVAQAQNRRHRGQEVEAPSYELRAASGIAAWSYLDGTRRETEQIAGELDSRKVSYKYLTKLEGDEDSFKQLDGKSSDVLFLATHGFFFSNSDIERYKGLRQALGGSKKKQVEENPLLRSGLVLSKVNKYWLSPTVDNDEEDNILTAAEIAKMNLTKTKLVILSACETGLGDIKDGEGVFGLQRAFRLAGVESLIMSLWKVPDEATALLMSTFYRQWLNGSGRQSAFKLAQQTVRAQYPEPFYWAAFVMLD